VAMRPYAAVTVACCLDRSPGFGITLTAETTGGSFLCAEACSRPHGSTEERVSADDIGAKAAFNLLAEIYKVSFLLILDCGSLDTSWHVVRPHRCNVCGLLLQTL